MVIYLTMVICNKCKKPKSDFEKRSDRDTYRKTCKECRATRRRERTQNNYKCNKTRISSYNKDKRKTNPLRFILEDSRRSDKKKGLENDITKEFLESVIDGYGCKYCGETRIRMTLDRIDNSLGHLQSNVIPACIRCNLARGSMPYMAWLHLVPSMREARELGLFGDWNGK